MVFTAWWYVVNNNQNRIWALFACVVFVMLASLTAWLIGSNAYKASNFSNIEGLICEEPVLDLGSINQSKAKIEHTFILKNNSSRKINITDINKSCTCTSVEANNKCVLPGSIVKIFATNDWSSDKGDLTSNVILKTDYPEFPFIKLSIKATVKPDVGVMPSGLNFGLLKLNERKTKFFEVFDSTNSAQIIKVDNENSDISVSRLDVNGMVNDALYLEGGPGKFSVTVKPSGKSGLQYNKMVLHTDSKRYPTILVTVVYQCRAP